MAHPGERVRAASGEVAAQLRHRLVLVITWCLEAPQQEGAFFAPPPGHPGATVIIGRGPGHPGEGDARLWPTWFTADGDLRRIPLMCPSVALSHLRLRAEGEHCLDVENIGHCPMTVDGEAAERATVHPGQTVELKGRLQLLCLKWPGPELSAGGAVLPPHPFGGADEDGLVGEGPVAWALRRCIAAAAALNLPVLLHGPSGSGKRTAAAAIHRGSERRGRPWIPRSGALTTGDEAAPPSPGTWTRWIGEADGTTLFVEDLDALPGPAQHLLIKTAARSVERAGRDPQGGARLIAATRRPLRRLDEALVEAFPVQIPVPGLQARQEDIPLLVRHLLSRLASERPEVADRFFRGGLPSGEPNIAPSLMRDLVQRPYEEHLVELGRLIERAVESSLGMWIERPDDRDPLFGPRAPRPSAQLPSPPAARPHSSAFRRLARAALSDPFAPLPPAPRPRDPMEPVVEQLSLSTGPSLVSRRTLTPRPVMAQATPSVVDAAVAQAGRVEALRRRRRGLGDPFAGRVERESASQPGEGAATPTPEVSGDPGEEPTEHGRSGNPLPDGEGPIPSLRRRLFQAQAWAARQMDAALGSLKRGITDPSVEGLRELEPPSARPLGTDEPTVIIDAPTAADDAAPLDQAPAAAEAATPGADAPGPPRPRPATALDGAPTSPPPEVNPAAPVDDDPLSAPAAPHPPRPAEAEGGTRASADAGPPGPRADTAREDRPAAPAASRSSTPRAEAEREDRPPDDADEAATDPDLPHRAALAALGTADGDVAAPFRHRRPGEAPADVPDPPPAQAPVAAASGRSARGPLVLDPFAGAPPEPLGPPIVASLQGSATVDDAMVEAALIDLLRRHRFSVERAAEDPECSFAASTLQLRLSLLICRALEESGGSRGTAVARLAGPWGQGRRELEAHVDALVNDLQRRVRARGQAGLLSEVGREYGRHGSRVLSIVRRVVEGSISP